jgi:amino acid adenylation domain-containing protein
MSQRRGLHQLLDQSAASSPGRTAIEEVQGASISYGDLAELSDALRDRLWQLGVRPGDRVGIYLRKSIDAVAAIFATLKAGAAYVPVDPDTPLSRNAYILKDCAVRVVLVERQWSDELAAQLAGGEVAPILLVLDEVGGGESLRRTLAAHGTRAAPVATHIPKPDDLAYVLYTSGSTGRPKGVMLSHRSALSFVDWCSATFEPNGADCFSSHAPFHFDLSIFDLYVAIKHGAKLVLIGERLGKDPRQLAAAMAGHHISIWYSVPSILTLLARYGKLERHDLTALRLLLFAGEVFPIPHLRQLKSLLPASRYFNLYGPTETNVCTAYELPPVIPDDRTEPFPIGKTCAHLRTMVVDTHGQPVTRGVEGELCVSGAAVMSGYWNMGEETRRAFIETAPDERWYRTGDLVSEEPDGTYLFRGRRDRMVKRRGYRVELGEIEAGLYRHPAIKEAAVIAVETTDAGVQIKAFVSTENNTRPSIIDLKRFCGEVLPPYMAPDVFHICAALPKTSRGKIDYQRLQSAP